MGDIRAPDNKDLAYKDYMEGMKYKDIASKYNVSISTVKSWKTRYKWDRKSMHTKNEKVCIQKGINNNINKTMKTGKKANSRLSNPPYPTLARVNNKNAVTTGEFERIFFDTLEEDELNLIKNIEVEKKKLIEQEIQLFTVRERRMLKRIDDLKKSEEVVIDTETHGTQGDAEVSLVNYESTLNKIQALEEALTRVQDKKQKAIDSLHKFEIDEQKLELTVMKLELEIMKQGVQDDEVEDDGFIGALEAQVGDAWDD